MAKSGDQFIIISETTFDGSVRITATRSNVPTVSSSAKMIAYGDPNLQDVVTGVKNADAVRAYLNVETPTGTIALKKTSEDGVVAGISFVIKGEKNFNKTVTTDENGNITVEGLFPGTYTVTEQSIDKYEPEKSFIKSYAAVCLEGALCLAVSSSPSLRLPRLRLTRTLRRCRWYGAISGSWYLTCSS